MQKQYYADRPIQGSIFEREKHPTMSIAEWTDNEGTYECRNTNTVPNPVSDKSKACPLRGGGTPIFELNFEFPISNIYRLRIRRLAE